MHLSACAGVQLHAEQHVARLLSGYLEEHKWLLCESHVQSQPACQVLGVTCRHRCQLCEGCRAGQCVPGGDALLPWAGESSRAVPAMAGTGKLQEHTCSSLQD